jgi:hypothetical protein
VRAGSWWYHSSDLKKPLTVYVAAPKGSSQNSNLNGSDGAISEGIHVEEMATELGERTSFWVQMLARERHRQSCESYPIPGPESLSLRIASPPKWRVL